MFQFSIKVNDLSENANEFSVFSRFSQHNNAKKIAIRQQLIMIRNEENLSKSVKYCLIPNHFNCHTCKFHAFMYKKGFVNVPGKFAFMSILNLQLESTMLNTVLGIISYI